jgi:Protein of unknown function (DUF3591)/Bromodomain
MSNCFLFGNVDKKGRLDEDYLEDDARDQIGYVAPTVADRDENLREISSAAAGVPSIPGAPSDDDENYENDEEDAAGRAGCAQNGGGAGTGAEDFYDEMEVMDLDEEEQKRMASVALAMPTAASDDENYDDDDEEVAAKPASGNAELACSASVPVASVPAPPLFTSAPPKPADSPVLSAPASPELSAAEASQRKLLNAARMKGAVSPGTATAQEPLSFLPDNEPLRFSVVLSQPTNRLPTVARRKRYGLSVEQPTAFLQAPDDATILETTPAPLPIDPTNLFLQSDAVTRPEPHRKAVAQTKCADVDFIESAAPLVASSTSLNLNTSVADLSSCHSMLQQVAWETDIKWEESEGDDDDGSDENADGEEDKDKHIDGKCVHQGGAPDDDLDAEDDMEWEDGGAVTAPLQPLGVTGDAVQKKTLQDHPGNELTNVQCQIKSTGAPPASVSDRIIGSVLTPNVDLVAGTWLRDVAWDSEGTGETSSTAFHGNGDLMSSDVEDEIGRLILDMNDKNMVIENLSSERATLAVTPQHQVVLNGHRMGNPFNISNDDFYAQTGGGGMLKLDRRAVLHGLRNAPPAVKAQTTLPNPRDMYLEHFHRPRLELDQPREEEMVPIRRKRPKGGNTQVAGLVPKKQAELLVSAKDAFRVCVFEFAIEHAPCLLPVPGMASRVVTYDRKDSIAATNKARKEVAGTPNADTVFLAPDELPPLHAGDLLATEGPLLVLESHLFSAPCTRCDPATTDFLVTRRKQKMYVREIDSVLSVGVTEPKLEVMAPNTDRFKKFAKDRVLLWLLRELFKNQKKKDGGGIAAIDRENLFEEFTRRRTFPETSLIKMLKELSRYQNGKYVLADEPPKGYAAMEAEWLRTITPEETCAFEAMESGWHRLVSVGIQIFTHPTSQSNIRGAAEKTGLSEGVPIGSFIWNQLLKAPWYRSQIMMAAQRQQRKELMHSLSMARIVNDLHEGGAVMENRLASLTAAESANVLANQFRFQARKIPPDSEARRELVRDVALRKGKGTESVDYQEVIASIIMKQRNVGNNRTAAGAGVTAAVAAGGVMIIPLQLQRKALEHGIVNDLPNEEERTSMQEDTSSLAAIRTGQVDTESAIATGIDVGGKTKKQGLSKRKQQKVQEQLTAMSVAMSQRQLDDGEDEAELKRMLNSSVMGASDGSVRKKSNPKRLKITRKRAGPDNSDVVEYVTDPIEIERLLANKRNRVKKTTSAGQNSGSNAPGDQSVCGTPLGGSKLKIAINVRKLSQGGKAGMRNKQGPTSFDRRRLAAVEAKKVAGAGEGHGDDDSPLAKPVAVTHEGGGSKKGSKGDGQVGKIKINQKAVKKAQEEKLAKRKRSQYGEGMEYPARKAPRKSGATSRRQRNGTVVLNGLLETVEKAVREARGYIVNNVSDLSLLQIARVKPGESEPAGIATSNLACPANAFLDFTAAVDVKNNPMYKEVVKKQMYLDLIKHKCKQMKYQSSIEFLKDIQLMLDNARAFNSKPDAQWVVQHASLLYDVAVEEIEGKNQEIIAAEQEVLKERATNANVPTGGVGGSNTALESKRQPKSTIDSRVAAPRPTGKAKAVGSTNINSKFEPGNVSSSAFLDMSGVVQSVPVGEALYETAMFDGEDMAAAPADDAELALDLPDES